MQGAQKLRSEAHLRVRRNDEVAAQRRRWTFYETINFANRKVQFWGKSVNQLFLVPCWISLQFFARYRGRKVRNLEFLPHFEAKNKRS